MLATTPTGIRADYPEPLWVQAAELITKEITSGALKPGSRLPPERELCIQLDISRVTLRKALNKLVEDGLLEASHGRGWYVATTAMSKEWPNSLESFSETARRMGLSATSRVLTSTTYPATIDEAEEFLIAPGTRMFSLDRVRLLDGVPTAIDYATIPLHLVPGFESIDFTTTSLYEQLQLAGITPVRADSTIEAREADEYAAKHLDIGVGKPLLVMHQRVVDATDKPVFASKIQYSGERYRLRTFFARRR
ncbi:GntR family transcriptional regulator [Microbacteriaceae bacterium SG_E_30_P1]|uniref:GntR family transcriptional regulator n=1 Tax=Antiquaquibacter oligotrophicus TaxID=2880260 RepID=A0ABT6KQ90_9MICO|nr:GntR family transcriptional regulator [Antiquaquibacter oligotrophicus]MDH6182151.1 GntR family transcriptional regulator [Antiquaquibacter oligotrophicus]UDF12186.1 GntR family transcriptional regulator [Antiquaquibacter oligotrophicus]